jgi:hypothetical protein
VAFFERQELRDFENLGVLVSPRGRVTGWQVRRPGEGRQFGFCWLDTKTPEVYKTSGVF